MESADLPREFRRHRVEMLAAARNPPLSVAPDAPIAEATTAMLSNDFSQVPVMQGARGVKGLVSWKSLGRRQALGHAPCERARDGMDRVEVVNINDSLFDVIPLIARQDCVLVQDEQRLITGIITAFDISVQLQAFAEPFWRLEDAEMYLRTLLEECLTPADFDLLDRARITGNGPQAIDDLTFGQYVELLSKPQCWERVGQNLDRGTFLAQLTRANHIRNRLMHFRCEKELSESDRTFLATFSRFLGQVLKARRNLL